MKTLYRLLLACATMSIACVGSVDPEQAIEAQMRMIQHYDDPLSEQREQFDLVKLESEADVILECEITVPQVVQGAKYSFPLKATEQSARQPWYMSASGTISDLWTDEGLAGYVHHSAYLLRANDTEVVINVSVAWDLPSIGKGEFEHEVIIPYGRESDIILENDGTMMARFRKPMSPNLRLPLTACGTLAEGWRPGPRAVDDAER